MDRSDHVRPADRNQTFASGVLPLVSTLLALTPLAAPQSVDWMPARLLLRTTNHSMAFDAVRGRAVFFGGWNYMGPMRPETWEWDGSGWRLRSPATSPSVRAGHALAYDVARRRVLLFGGWSTTQPLGDTWEWNGETWAQRFPTTAPAPRSGHAMVYDVARQRIVMFGGQGATQTLGDTWEWDGSNWSQRISTTSPAPRIGHAMAYDLARRRTVLFGGHGNPTLADTWEWDGSTWQHRSAPGPNGRLGAAMAYDAARQRVVLYGGQDVCEFCTLFDVWEWDGAAWLQRTPATQARVGGPSLVYDSVRQRTLLLGACKEYNIGRSCNVAWEWNGNDWSPRLPHPAPRVQSGHAMAYDTARGEAILFGGLQYRHPGFELVSETWTWNGSRWSERTPASSPTARSSHAMTYDIARQRTVLFGGSTNTGPSPSGETWEWDGRTWVQHLPATNPGPRQGHAMAHDLVRQRVLLFGGSDGRSIMNDTWEWDGASWSRLVPATAPPKRLGHAMAYDFVRRRMVLFAGSDGGLLADTWEWDGSNWSQARPQASPRARIGHAMAFDLARRRVMLFGGWSGTYLADTWEWDGSNWVQSATATTPGAREAHAMVYDVHRQRLVMVGEDTWLLGPLQPAATQAFGTACPGSQGLPVLTSGTPFLGNVGFAIDLLSARGSSSCVFGLSTTTQTMPIGPCTLYLGAPVVALGATTNVFGFSSIRLPIPADVAQRGLSLYAQAVIVDPQAPVLGLACTQGLRLVLGD